MNLEIINLAMRAGLLVFFGMVLVGKGVLILAVQERLTWVDRVAALGFWCFGCASSVAGFRSLISGIKEVLG